MGFAITCAQKPLLPEFGALPDITDMQMKEYEKDKSAAALILAENGEVTFDQDNSGELVMERKIVKRFKLFTDKGLDHADVKIYYRSDEKYERVRDIAGYVYNLSEKGNIISVKLAEDNIIRKQETDNTASVNFSLPEVKPGSVFEYRYTVLKKSFTRIDPWLLQHPIPARVSRFSVETLPGDRFNVNFTIWPGNKLQREEKEMTSKVLSTGRGSVRYTPTRNTYTLYDVEAFKSEPYMPGVKNYIQRIEFNYSGSETERRYPNWKSIAVELDDDFYFGDQLKKKIVIPELEEALTKITGYHEKVRYIHQFVRKSFTWDGIEDFLSLNVKKINREKKGSTGDINLLLINLLQHHGIEAYPLLCSTTDNGPVNHVYPNPKQFNTLNAIVKENDKWYILNGADKYNPTHLVPYDIMNTRALLLKREEEPKWIEIWEPGMIEKQSVAYMAQISADGQISGNAYIYSSGYARAPREKDMEEGNEKFAKKYFGATVPGMVIEDFSVKNKEDDEQELVQQFKFSYKTNNAGDYLYFNTNLFTGLEKNPFIAEKRVSDISFRFNRRIVLNTRITLPENYQVEELPKSTLLLMPDSSISFTRVYSLEENVIIPIRL